MGVITLMSRSKNSDDGTEIFNAHTHTSVGFLSEDMIEIDFTISRVGDLVGEDSVAEFECALAEPQRLPIEQSLRPDRINDLQKRELMKIHIAGADSSNDRARTRRDPSG
jgi:hypothetical protein